jgi:hypothetical protein
MRKWERGEINARKPGASLQQFVFLIEHVIIAVQTAAARDRGKTLKAYCDFLFGNVC